MDEQNIKRFEASLDIMKKYDFKPIACCIMMTEETYVFKTKKEATLAHKFFEKRPSLALKDKHHTIQAWWYGQDEFFPKTINEYKKDVGYEPQIIFVDDNLELIRTDEFNLI